MSADLTWSGLDDLARDLASLPGAVRAEFKPIVTDGAERIASRYLSELTAAGAESVGRGTRVQTGADADDISARVINPSPLGHLWEFGTVDRYTSKGAYRGRMPSTPTFVPIVEQERAQVDRGLAGGLQRIGSLKTLAVR